MSDDDSVILTPRYAPRLRPTPIPASGAFDAPLVCLTVNRKWAAHILGALDVLDQPDTWIGTPEQVEAARQSVRQIKVALSLGNCTDTGETMFDIRLKPNNNCIIQKTLDGGVTWIDAIDMSNCWKTGIRRNPATGETGYYDGIDFYRFPDGAWIDPPSSSLFPPPRNDRSGTEQQMRCDAAHGAALALQGLYRETWDALANVLEDGLWIVAGEVVQWLSIYIGAALDPATLALTMSFLENAAGYESNGFPDTELENVQNDLYCNSSVTNGAVIFDRAAISSLWQTKDREPYGGLRSLIDFFLGDEGLNAAGNVQAGTGDCSSAECNDTWCYTFDFTQSNGGWATFDISDLAGDQLTGVYTPGVGWEDTFTSAVGVRGVSIRRLFAPTVLTSVNVDLEYTSGVCQELCNHSIQLRSGGVVVLQGAQNDWSLNTNLTVDEVRVYLEVGDRANNSDPGGTGVITRITLHGTGANPFGEDNCS